MSKSSQTSRRRAARRAPQSGRGADQPQSFPCEKNDRAPISCSYGFVRASAEGSGSSVTRCASSRRLPRRPRPLPTSAWPRRGTYSDVWQLSDSRKPRALQSGPEFPLRRRSRVRRISRGPIGWFADTIPDTASPYQPNRARSRCNRYTRPCRGLGVANSSIPRRQPERQRRPLPGFFRPRTPEDVHQADVALVAGVFEHRLLGFLHRHERGERPRERGRVLDREFVMQVAPSTRRKRSVRVSAATVPTAVATDGLKLAVLSVKFVVLTTSVSPSHRPRTHPPTAASSPAAAGGCRAARCGRRGSSR